MIKKKKTSIVQIVWNLPFFLLPFLLPLTGAESGPKQEIPFRADKLSDRVLFIKSGQSAVMSNVTAVATSQGLVVIDAHYKPECGHKIRQIVEKTFGRKDFVYLIYTHAGVDHMGGASVFPEALLIGHDNCPMRIDALREQLQSVDIREAMKPRLQSIQDQIDAGPASPEARIKLQEAMLYWSELTELMATGLEHIKPAITFDDSLTLHLGDVRVKLRYCTPGYSESDILIHVPEEKLLVVGDIFNKDRIPLISEKTDIRRWIDVFKPFVEGEEDVDYIVGAHDELMTLPELNVQLDYLEDLWEGVTDARREGLTLEQAKAEFSFEKKFPQLSHLGKRWVSWPHDLHERNIEKIWEAAELSGPYLGQKPPGMTPELFAPGILPTKDNEALYGFFNNATLCLFDRTPVDLEEWTPAVYRMELKAGKWTPPNASPFLGKHWYHYYKTAPEGEQVYFAWRGSIGEKTSSTDVNIWRVRMASEGWTEPNKLPPPVNSMDMDTYPKVTADGTLYFFSNREGGFGGHDIYRSPSTKGKHMTVENLGKPINTENDELDPFIAPDESYLIFCSKTLEGFGGFDLYVSFHKSNGTWTDPVNMGERDQYVCL